MLRPHLGTSFFKPLLCTWGNLFDIWIFFYTPKISTYLTYLKYVCSFITKSIKRCSYVCRHYHLTLYNHRNSLFIPCFKNLQKVKKNSKSQNIASLKSQIKVTTKKNTESLKCQNFLVLVKTKAMNRWWKETAFIL